MQRVMREKEEAAAAAAAALGSADEEEEEVPVKRKPNAFAMVRMLLVLPLSLRSYPSIPHWPFPTGI